MKEINMKSKNDTQFKDNELVISALIARNIELNEDITSLKDNVTDLKKIKKIPLFTSFIATFLFNFFIQRWVYDVNIFDAFYVFIASWYVSLFAYRVIMLLGWVYEDFIDEMKYEK